MGAEAISVVVDIRDEAEMDRALKKHLQRFGSLDIVCLNAGIAEKGQQFDDSTVGNKRCLVPNLEGVG